MEHGELIHDFVDGTLDSNLENGLFVELASNQQLRTELKQFIEFERTARYDTAAYAPSAESTANVFSRLGIPLPLATTAVVAPATTGMMAFLGKYSQGIIGGVVAMLITASVMYFAMDKGQQSSVNSQKTAVNSQQSAVNSQQSVVAQSNDIPIVKSEEKITPKVIEKVVIKYVDRPVYIEQTTDSKQLAETPINEQLAVSNEVDNNLVNNMDFATTDGIFNQSVNLFSGINHSSLNPVGVQEMPFYPSLGLFDYLGKAGISFELTGADYWMFPKETVPKQLNPLLENNRMAIILKLSDELQVGAEVRQEFFFHEYKDSDYLYKQNNNYFSGGVFGRWTPLNYNYASFFSQVSFGGNVGGQVGRVMIGTLIKPSSDYSFVIGLEGSGMMYNHNGDILFAKKLGLHYGILFNF